MKLSRGLFALLLTLFFHSSLLAEYLYKDELIFNPAFTQEIEKIGLELHQKTGIALRLVMLKKLPEGKGMVAYEEQMLQTLSEPTILLVFSEKDTKVDILANDASLYALFDKKQVLSPVASYVQAFFVALFYSDSFATFKELTTNYGGAIIPLLAQKSKENELLGKYSGAMFNGYADIAQQIATSKGVVLESGVGDANQKSILAVKVLFYGFLLYALFLYIKRKIYRRRENESK